MDKFKIVFVNFPTLSASQVAGCFKQRPTNYFHVIPLGIVHLAAVLENEKFVNSIECLDYCVELENASDYVSYETFIDTVAAKINYKPDILAYSINFSTQHDFFVRCEKQLRKKWPQSIAIVGGTHATNATREIFHLSSVDYLVRGEAETSLPQLVKLINDEKLDEIGSVKGVYSRKSITKEKTLDISEYPNLSELPIPAWHIFEMDRYTHNDDSKQGEGERLVEVQGINKIRGECSIMTSRGCPFHCTFCSSFSVHGRQMRYFSIEWTKRMCKELYEKYDVSGFQIQDDLFTVDKNRTIELLSEIQNLSIPNLALHVRNALSINTLSEPVIDELAKSGMNVACLAIESGSEFVNRYIIKKRVRLNKVPNVIRMFRERGVFTRCYFIMGFPGETQEMMEESVNFAQTINSDWCTFAAVKPLIGTPLYDQMVEENYIDHDPEYWTQSAYGSREFDTKEISKDRLNDLLYDANIRINFFENYNVTAGNYSVAIEMIQDIVTMYPYHVVGLYILHICFKKMKKYTEAQEKIGRIKELVKTNPQAASMFKKYRDRMPELEHFQPNYFQEESNFREELSSMQTFEQETEEAYSVAAERAHSVAG